MMVRDLARRIGWVVAFCLLPVFPAWGLVYVSDSGANFVEYTGCYTTCNTGGLQATAKFQKDGFGNLIVTLTNTSSGDVLVPANVLTAIGFTLTGVTLSPTSALLAGGSTVFYDPDGQPAGGNVGGEWAYASNIDFHGAKQGISSSGLGLFGQPNFQGPNLAPPDAVDGLQYGILSAGDNSATGNGGITGSGGLIKNSVQFTLAATSGVLDLNNLGSILFQYGTSLGEPTIAEPATPVLVALGILGLIVVRRRLL